MLNNPEWTQMLLQVVRDVNKQVFPKNYVEVIGQKWRENFNIYDAFSFSLINHAIKTGLIAIFQIPVNSEPFPDKDVLNNNEVLKKLEYPFSGEFYGGTQGEDGYIHWSRPINAVIRTEDEVSFVIVEPLIDKDGSHHVCPLEVGYIPFEKTLHYLNNFFIETRPKVGLARWPYKQDKITVFVNHGFYGADDEKFGELIKQVYGDFQTLPNPWNSW